MEGQGFQACGLTSFLHMPGLVTMPPGVPQVRAAPAINPLLHKHQIPSRSPSGKLNKQGGPLIGKDYMPGLPTLGFCDKDRSRREVEILNPHLGQFAIPGTGQ
jgi:hypothetical protein